MHLPLSRRDILRTASTGIGALALGSLLGEQRLLAQEPAANPLAPKKPHLQPRAKRLIHLFMNGGVSQVDTFDHKPALEKYKGQRPPSVNLSTERRTFNLMPSPFAFTKHGQSGLEISSLFSHVAECADDLCVIRSMHTDIPNHDPSLLMMTSGSSSMSHTKICF